MIQALFVALFGAGAIWFGIRVFRTSSMVRSALSLLGAMVAIGGMFFALEAEFLGALQVMMMATEMSIMAIFMVMYMMDPGGLGQMEMSHQKRAALIAGIAAGVTGVVAAVLVDWGSVTDIVDAPEEQIRRLGLELMERSMLIFETAGVAILVSMIAAIAVAVARSTEE